MMRLPIIGQQNVSSHFLCFHRKTFLALLFGLETSNRTVLIVYESLPYHQVVEFCQCMNMDLAAPRSMEEAQEIDRRGELKFDYFTNYIRIRIDFAKYHRSHII